MQMTTRKLERVIPSIPASEGAGVKLRRSLGASKLERHDPLLKRDGVDLKVIAGKLGETSGPIRGGSTDPYYFDVHLAPRAVFEEALPAEHSAFLYVYEGEALVGEERKAVAHRAAGLLSNAE